MYERNLKRVADIVVSSLMLVVLAAPFVLIALWIKINSKGPIIFKQIRYGKDKEHFMVYKFRTMSIHAPSDRSTGDFHDSHSYITGPGRIMRKLSIDELPQLVNILRGEMSLIGPRPVVLSETSLIKLRDKYGANSLRPGITGWAQANGRDKLNDVEKAKMDGYYVKNVTFATDMKCIMKTIWVIVSVAGHIEGHERQQQRIMNEAE
jgi:O-antigen biosynthesis protein WbqP